MAPAIISIDYLVSSSFFGPPISWLICGNYGRFTDYMLTKNQEGVHAAKIAAFMVNILAMSNLQRPTAAINI